MQNIKKLLPYLGWTFFGIMLVWVAYDSFFRNDTVDFRGTVNKIYFNEADNCAYIEATMVFGTSPTTIRASQNISVTSYDGKKMSIYDIKAGDMIDLDYKGTIDESESVITAKWIKVYPAV